MGAFRGPGFGRFMGLPPRCCLGCLGVVVALFVLRAMLLSGDFWRGRRVCCAGFRVGFLAVPRWWCPGSLPPLASLLGAPSSSGCAPSSRSLALRRSIATPTLLQVSLVALVRGPVAVFPCRLLRRASLRQRAGQWPRWRARAGRWPLARARRRRRAGWRPRLVLGSSWAALRGCNVLCCCE